ncbi:MAG: hypothetical protein D6768_05645 [Chloroflexi bacterium]|nr:MAG: hypothetical protein D6768_05645 [Chloroflexota bacterium]
MKKQLGCLSGTGIAAAFGVLIVLTLLLWFSGGSIFNPGGLSAQNQEGQQLGGVTSHAELISDCSACHAAPWSADSMSDRCLNCHTAISAELDDPNSLHSVMMPNGFIPCRDCHTEHNGETALLTSVDPNTFPHAAATGFALTAHEEDDEALACADCHGQNLTVFEPSTCDTCHRDLNVAFMESHTAAFGSQCLACHDGIDTYGEAFDHNRTDFPLEGEHREAACADCHQNQTTLAALQTTDQSCYACHAADDAHGGELGQNCAICHTAQSWESTTFNHALTAFPLLGAHENAECEQCHINNQFTGTPTDCYACHKKDDAHNGGFGQACEQCHNTKTWEDATFDHNLTDFPLTGAHQRTECEQCHINNQFAGTPTNCYACHAKDDDHNGRFGQKCELCHSTKAWEPATFTGRDHTFPINHGRRENSPCETCHPTVLDQYTCYGCHEHTPDKIRREHLEEGIRNFEDCFDCHPDGREHDD